MEELKIGTKIKIKSPEKLKELFNKEYYRTRNEWNKNINGGKLVFLDDMLQYCNRECTTSSNFNGLGYYVEEFGCYWNPDWFEVIEEHTIGVGDTVILKSLTEAAKDIETLNSFRYTFGELTCEDMWGKEFYVNQADDKKIIIEQKNGRHVYIPHAWVSEIITSEETYRREIEKYIREHNLEKELPGEDAPYDWGIEIDKHHRFIQAVVDVDEFKFKVYEDPFETFIVEKI